METLLRKYLWAIDFGAIVLCAFFAARATSVLAGSALAKNTPPPRPAHHSLLAPATAPTFYGKDVESILNRNMFCSTCPPILKKPEEDKGPAPVPQPVRTALPLRLMAIMYSPPPNDPRWSMAVIRDTEQNSAGPYAIESTIRGATIKDIQETRVYLDNAGKPEYLDLIDKPQAAAPAAVAAAPAAAPADPFTAELDKGIKKVTENSYEVQRSTLDTMLGNMAVLARSARIVPEVKDGKSAGFRLFGVKPDGPFGKIGLQNGDVISQINGLEMTSPDKALEVYTKLRSASHLSVALERSGQKITKDYNIR